MGLPAPLIVVLAFLPAIVCGIAWWRERRARSRAQAIAAGAESQAAASNRLLRLAAAEQRSVALALIGQSHVAGGSGFAGCANLLADKLVGMSESLLAQSEAPGAVRCLEEETVPLLPVLEFAISQVAAGLGPGRRAWRIGGMPEGIALLADKRALNQILVNVLSGAAASTRDGDGIEVSFHEGGGMLLLQVEDEGAGLPVAEAGGHESRGIGYGLILARSLMEAHGGRLDVESLARIGTRVRLRFPADRARRTA